MTKQDHRHTTNDYLFHLPPFLCFSFTWINVQVYHKFIPQGAPASMQGHHITTQEAPLIQGQPCQAMSPRLTQGRRHNPSLDSDPRNCSSDQSPGQTAQLKQAAGCSIYQEMGWGRDAGTNVTMASPCLRLHIPSLYLNLTERLPLKLY